MSKYYPISLERLKSTPVCFKSQKNIFRIFERFFDMNILQSNTFLKFIIQLVFEGLEKIHTVSVSTKNLYLKFFTTCHVNMSYDNVQSLDITRYVN